jgi:isoleucyl-tRNA synthetase
LEKDGKEFKRVPEVLDCWFESGAMPFAQFHYPFENKKLFEDNFPSQFVAEYIGQVRAWFYYMLSLSAILFDDIPFENVVTTGTILAEDGEKMSKSKKNFPDPQILIDKYGADSLRFYLMSTPVMNADNINFSEKSVEEIYKKVILLMYNTLNFYEDYGKGEKIQEPKSKDILDKWILSKTNQLVKEYDEYFSNYNTIKSCSVIRSFVDDLSTWYVRRTRDRFNAGDENAVKTLGYVLDVLAKVSAPIMPFVSEKIYQTLHGEKESVHLQDWAKTNLKNIDNKLMDNMENVREVVSLGLRERDRNHIGLKWPLASINVKAKFDLNKEVKEIVKEELNVKKIELKSKSSGEISVELDTEMTPDLEAEGYAREISRKVQGFRKDLGLVKENKILLRLIVDGEFGKVLEKNVGMIKDRTNSKEVEVVTTGEERFKNVLAFDIKERSGKIGLEKVV